MSSVDDDLAEAVLDHERLLDQRESLDAAETNDVEEAEKPSVRVPRKVSVLEGVDEHLVRVALNVAVLAVVVVLVSVVSRDELVLFGNKPFVRLAGKLDGLLHVEAGQLKSLQVVQRADGVTLVLVLSVLVVHGARVGDDLSSLFAALRVSIRLVMVRFHVHVEGRTSAHTVTDLIGDFHEALQVAQELRLGIVALIDTEADYVQDNDCSDDTICVFSSSLHDEHQDRRHKECEEEYEN